MRDIHHSMSPVMAFNPAIISVTGTTDGNSVDLRGYDACEFVWTVGAMNAGTIAINIQDSDDNSAWADVAAIGLLGSEETFDSGDDDQVGKIGYVGGKRYVRCQMVAVVAATGGNHVAAFAIRAKPSFQPKT